MWYTSNGKIGRATSTDGALLMVLERADVELLVATGWRFPERFMFRARDGVTDLYGVLWRPADFDPGKGYPVIEWNYPGPQTNLTPRTFVGPGNRGDSLCQLGFIVVSMDGLGTPMRSKTFHDVSYKNLQGADGLPDHVLGLRQLAARYPYMDLSRVGMFGHSGGGYATVRAMPEYPDFYKIGVSSAGSHDSRAYVAFWGEKYQGLLEEGAYPAQDNRTLAANLKGKLLLVYGDLDDNCHPAMTIQLIDELIKHNKVL